MSDPDYARLATRLAIIAASLAVAPTGRHFLGNILTTNDLDDSETMGIQLDPIRTTTPPLQVTAIDTDDYVNGRAIRRAVADAYRTASTLPVGVMGLVLDYDINGLPVEDLRRDKISVTLSRL